MGYLALTHITFMIPSDFWTYEQFKCYCIILIKQPKNFILSLLDYFYISFLKTERVHVPVMTILQTNFYPIPFVI